MITRYLILIHTDIYLYNILPNYSMKELMLPNICNVPLCNSYQNMATTQKYRAIKTVHISNMSKPCSEKHCAMMPSRCL